MKKQVILPFLPGYMFNGRTVLSTGVAIPPTQFIDQNTGETIYYVRPIFECGGVFVGMYIKHSGIVNWINSSQD
jgi:hypothetical protein